MSSSGSGGGESVDDGMVQQDGSSLSRSPYEPSVNAADHASCEQMSGAAQALNPEVRQLLASMQSFGCPPPAIKCVRCTLQVGGGYERGLGVVLCEDRIRDQSSMNNILTHELVHALDDCRVRNMDWGNLAHHACSEIRAANLSGDCSFLKEVMRGKVGGAFRGHYQMCIKRRAVLSLEINPACSSRLEAQKAVDTVFPICFEDWTPFDKLP
ncbi:mitochondrial Complex V (CV) inner mitochondrial membrane metalloprotease (Atp23) [Andalucia godoyi]|uniref:Mitochondrial inner membrane protease ATP23 n=1 Tax=Andalucia godoyi TaxID=505711 RepID=A0A8K0AGE3_ANDGO|nr:mitochondrial Complex V (CV) inner mitochondrial membrane metalloprotease (Atp23) [Andalucia godoyi]|eukprot:ANDGO_05847.mRNA.1 mitochondrial Complex V (CV) inner mitochondrial membrane metalloprotease (Atp23)